GFFDVIAIPAAGGDETAIVQVATGDNQIVRPTLGADGRVYFGEAKGFGGDGSGPRPNSGIEVASVRRDGSDRIVHARIV
ncbi:hypothetical protein NL529_33255, partial [Klebsiella pneumoniae]|nr:hypothetical protein [Klebsiella pneumoniae]